MIKKDATEMTTEEKLKTLYQLQTVRSAIDEKKALRGELPLEVMDLSDEIQGLETRAEKIKREIDDFDFAVKQKQGEIEEAQMMLDRYKAQLDVVANNREYDTLSKEIDFQQLEIEHCEKMIKEADQKMAERTRDLKRTETTIEERKQDLVEKRKELNEIMAETKEEEAQLNEQATELEAKIEPNLLASFKRIRKSARNGLGIVYVQRDACGGCFNKIPPQRQLDIKMRKKIIVCEYCGRILIDPELADVKVEAPKEEKPKKRTVRRKKADDDDVEE